MGNRILFQFKGKEYTAIVQLSLQEDGCYIFTFLQDPELISLYGSDIDITTDCVDVLYDHIINDEISALKIAILEAVKQLPAFHQQKPKKLVIRAEQLN